MTEVRFSNGPVARHFNHFLSDFFNSPAVWSNPSSDVSSLPAANVTETAGAYQLELNVPGRSKDDFKINVDKDLLTVSFEKKNTTEGVNTIRREFAVKSFKRSFSLDEKVDAGNIQAKYDNGILKIELPKKEEVKQEPKSISIS